MKNIIITENQYRLLCENQGDYGYHAGDLKHKTETLASKGFQITNTGHMGTGYYFYGNLQDAIEHATGFGGGGEGYSERRSVYKVDFSKYRMYDARNNATEFYETMKAITLGFAKVNERFFTTPQYKELLQDVHQALGGMGISIDIGSLDGNLQNFSYDIIDRDDGEMLASRIMKSAGYEGVDVRGTALDNFGVGSIIFDLKGGTMQRVNIGEPSSE